MQTGNLTQALEDTHAYPDYMISMVRIGEQTGRLDDVMDSLAVYYEKEDSLAESIKSAVTYPLIMIVMMLLSDVLWGTVIAITGIVLAYCLFCR